MTNLPGHVWPDKWTALSGPLSQVYDVTDQESFNNVKQWMNEIDRYANDKVRSHTVDQESFVPPRLWGVA